LRRGVPVSRRPRVKKPRRKGKRAFCARFFNHPQTLKKKKKGGKRGEKETGSTFGVIGFLSRGRGGGKKIGGKICHDPGVAGVRGGERTDCPLFCPVHGTGN